VSVVIRRSSVDSAAVAREQVDFSSESGMGEQAVQRLVRRVGATYRCARSEKRRWRLRDDGQHRDIFQMPISRNSSSVVVVRAVGPFPT